jgi:glycerol-3-phosphate acyltransferase PlsY
VDFSLSPESLLLGGLLGYLIGSIPFAFIITKRKAGLDIRQHGSRNVGARNAFDITGQKSIGRTVLALDLLKGLLPVLVFEYLGLSAPLIALLPALVLGHCYPVWLGFRGGRGLATAAGAMLLVSPALLFLWCLAYLLGNRIKDHVHFGSIFATGLALAAVLLVPIDILGATTLAFSGLAEHAPQLFISLLLVLLIILSRHIEPFFALVKGRS